MAEPRAGLSFHKSDVNVISDMDVTPSNAPTPAPSPPRRARTRQRLLAAGESLFAERGLHGVTSHDIAASAGVAAGTFYNHFPDKAHLFREIAHQALQELDRRLQLQAEPERSFQDDVRQHATALVQFAIDHRDLMRILFSPDTDAAAVQADVLARLAARVEEARRKAQQPTDGPAPIHPAVLAQALVGMWSRVLAWWAEDPERASPEVVIETLTQIQLNGTRPAQPGSIPI
jgi:AcrR family transcriptional regulator